MSANIRTTKLNITGMTCVSCERKIERKLKNTKGITSVKVSYSEGTALINFDENIISLNDIIKIIEQLDYKAVNEDKKPKSILEILGAVFILFALFFIINNSGALNVLNIFPQAQEGMGYGMLFVIGLLTSVHCVAMCGGINLSQCLNQKSKINIKDRKFSTIRPSLLYNLGRVISYTVIGGIVGGVGSVISFSGAAKGIIQLVAGIFMVIMGLNMLNIFPWLRKLNPRLPKIFTRKINEEKKSKSPLYVGLLNGLMPCGPLQAMQLYALSTGNPLKGAFSMFLFSMGTVPLMFGIGALSSVLSRKFTTKIIKAGAALVVILGIVMFSNGMSLSGIVIPTVNIVTKDNAQNANTATVVDGVQTITTKLSSGRYEPITVQIGVPVKWIIQAKPENINGCNNEIVIPKYNIEKKLEAGDNIIEFTPTESGKFAYSCWMGMIRSTITVVDDVNSDTVSDSSTNEPVDYSGLPSCCG